MMNKKYLGLYLTSINIEENLFQQYLKVFKNSQITYSLYDKLQIATESQFYTKISSNEKNMGIIFCQFGIEECLEWNNKKKIRAAVTPNQYIAEMCRKHNNCNVCIIGVECVGKHLAARIIHTFLQHHFDQEERNMIRVSKINTLDSSIPIGFE